ncbi:MAG: hypothetical protein QMB29_08485 [Urechidicola sp.]|jgi:hypothetical protein
MKKRLFLFCFIPLLSFSQETNKGKFYTATLYTTLALNEDYVPFNKEDGENLFDFSAIFIRNGMGYQFNKYWAASVNFGIDFHTRFGIQSLPAYFNLRHNIIISDDDLFFVNSSYGALWKPYSNFNRGDYYALGIGWQIAGMKRVNTLLRIDFHRKKIIGLNKGNLDSFSFGLGMNLF